MQKISGLAPWGSRILVRVRDGGDAPLYLDAAGTIAAPNPLTAAADGTWSAYVAEGIYSVTTSTPGQPAQTVRQVLVVPTRPVAVLAQQNTQVVAPTDTAENTLFSYTLPGGLLGPNDTLRIYVHMSCDSNANTKTVRARLGGTVATSNAVTTSVSGYLGARILNRNSRASQLVSLLNISTSALLSTMAVNTAVDQLFAVSIQKANAADNAALESVLVEWLPAAS